MLRYNFLVLQLIALIFALIAISTCSWEKVTLKDYEAVQTIYHSPLLTTLTTHNNHKINYHNATGYVLMIESGLMDICTYLQQPNHFSFERGHCKQTIARPSIGLAILGVICITIASVCTVFGDEEKCDDRHIRWLCYCSAVYSALGGLLLFTCHWTYSMSCELRLPTAYVQYGYSSYLIVIAALMSLLSMSLVLWRLYLYRVHYNRRRRMVHGRRRVSKKSNRR